MPTSTTFGLEYSRPNATTYWQDRIQDYVPVMYQTGEFDGTVQLFQLFAPIIDSIYQLIIDFPDLIDIDRTPARFLQRLSENIGVEPVFDVFDETQEVNFRRRELGKLTDSHKIRSIEASFLRILKYLGSEDYGVIFPYKEVMFLDVNPLDISPKLDFEGYTISDQIPIMNEPTNDVGEWLKPRKFDISFLCDGYQDYRGEIAGSRVIYSLPVRVIRSRVRLYWNNHEVPISHQHEDGVIERSFSFNQDNDVVVTNFVPLAGDRLEVVVEGSPYWHKVFRTEDAWYFRPGTAEIWAEIDPLIRKKAFVDRRPIGTLLYFSWLLRFFVTKCFPFPPEIDWSRNGYGPELPPHQSMTWDRLTPCDAPDPWWMQISNGYGWEAFWEVRGEYSWIQYLPYEAPWSESSDFAQEVGNEVNTFYGSEVRTSFFSIRTELLS